MSVKRIVAIGCVMLIPTWVLFGPVAAWHHMIIFGCLPYMAWSGEDVGSGLFDIALDDEVYAVGIHFGWLAINVGVWLAILLALTSVVRFGSVEKRP